MPVRVNLISKYFVFNIFSRILDEISVRYSMAWLSAFILLSLLTGSGVPMIDTHPYLLMGQAYLWSKGLRPWSYSYYCIQ